MLKYAVVGFISGHTYSVHRRYAAAVKAKNRMARQDKVVPWTYMVKRIG